MRLCGFKSRPRHHKPARRPFPREAGLHSKGDVAKRLRRRSAKPLCGGSNPPVASNALPELPSLSCQAPSSPKCRPHPLPALFRISDHVCSFLVPSLFRLLICKRPGKPRPQAGCCQLAPTPWLFQNLHSHSNQSAGTRSAYLFGGPELGLWMRINWKGLGSGVHKPAMSAIL